MAEHEPVNILLVDDQPSKLLSYEAILHDLGDRLLKASSGREALEHLLRNEIAVILVDVCMPDLDGFQLAAMIREHPRFQRTAMIFISAIHLTDMDRLRGYEMGAVDYVPVPVVPEVLRAKVKVFAELYRKTRQLERINAELERRVLMRTAELEASTRRLKQSEERRTLALVAGKMASWDWSRETGDCLWDDGQYRIFGVDKSQFAVSPENVRALVHPEDWETLQAAFDRLMRDGEPAQCEFRVRRPNGEVRWCFCTAAPSLDGNGQVMRISGVTTDITERKQAEERQSLLAREVDHRAKNALALVQSVVRLTRANTVKDFMAAVEGRIRALSQAHAVLSQSRWQGADLHGLVDEELAPYEIGELPRVTIRGPHLFLQPAAAQSLALVLHELVTNAAKYGALSTGTGSIELIWSLSPEKLTLRWTEKGGPPAAEPTTLGFGMRIIVASVEGQLGGRALFEWRPQGICCTLSVPACECMISEGLARERAESEDDSSSAGWPIALAGNRILVVEDEALVAIALRDALDQLGYVVIGPCNRIADAEAALRNNRVDAAVLDVNVGGHLIYPLADALIAENIPFVFVTGYGPDELDARFINVPVLQKPIETSILRMIFKQTIARPQASDSAASRTASPAEPRGPRRKRARV